MNENINLAVILSKYPKGTKLYSLIHGEVVLDRVDDIDISYPIVVKHGCRKFDFTYDGRYYIEYDGECVLFPSKEQRDWNKFKAPIEKFDYNTLKPFDKVLVRDDDGEGNYWRCALFSCMLSNGMLCECRWNQGVPYNDETKHLLGTCDMPDKKYIWWT